MRRSQSCNVLYLISVKMHSRVLYFLLHLDNLEGQLNMIQQSNNFPISQSQTRRLVAVMLLSYGYGHWYFNSFGRTEDFDDSLYFISDRRNIIPSSQLLHMIFPTRLDTVYTCAIFSFTGVLLYTATTLLPPINLWLFNELKMILDCCSRSPRHTICLHVTCL